MSLLISCEVGGERIPDWLLPPTDLDRPAGSHLPADTQLPAGSASSNGSQRSGSRESAPQPSRPQLISATDRPARYAAERLAHRLGVPLIANEHPVSLIDVTRPLHHRNVFSKWTKTLAPPERDRLVNEIYDPYIRQLRASIDSLIAQDGFLIHLSVRSFNLKNQGKVRRTDVGLLYDPSRGDEVDFCLDWIDEMWERAPMLRVRRNYPRRGTTEGLARRFRRELAAHDYLGIEIWLNRAWARRPVAIRDEAIDGMADSLGAILEDESHHEDESHGDAPQPESHGIEAKVLEADLEDTDQIESSGDTQRAA